ncbi:bifunctional cytidylyltransferase/SDR family oxidoreductase [uncultured Parabacteroides sp.]|uniref:bifunctional cytidylyltransferase/SDR family oxidoreductase n=1 Tax=Parabacteroides goldsteinii TaxID=328812 RepID=UPI002597E95D|nr:bifunctional cytidylyltransferase/SDR family oxidoreductase [uncultured Parabacteroides sp.]
MKNIAVVLAGGVGSRLNAGIPKQFLKVAGMTVIEHTISVFQHHPLIDEIAIVANEAYHVKIQEYVIKNQFRKVKKILMSGNERHFSSLSAIKAYEFEGECKLIFHDAVRPLLNPYIVSQVVEALDEYGAVDVAIPSADTIIEVDENNIITHIPQRKKLRRGQTPQGFRLGVIKEAYSVALKDPTFVTTDDCGVVLKYLPNQPVFVVPGEDVNMKLTYKEDFYLIEKLFQLRMMNFHDYSLSVSDREKLRGKKVVIFGASSGIGFDLMNLCKDCGAKVFGFSRSLNNVNVANAVDVRNALEIAAGQVGEIDYVVDTASLLYKESLVHMTYEQIDEAISVNYRGMVNVAKEAFLYLQKSHGHLLFYTSSSYTRGRMDYSIYSSTKCATVNFVQALAEEWAGFNIRVNCINPERTKTPMRVKNFGMEPDNTLLKPIDVAIVTAKALLSDLTGQVIDVKIKSI